MGGAGVDMLDGQNSDDILIGAFTSYDASTAKLQAIWTAVSLPLGDFA